MTEPSRQQTEPAPGAQQPRDNPCAPADQPRLPSSTCDPLPPAPAAPELPAPEECPTTCTCPEPPAVTHTCLEDLIDKEAGIINQAEVAKSFKADLEALLAKAKAAQDEYTTDKYDALLERWQDEDAAIVELIKKLVCAYPCWRCMLECLICRLIYAVRDLERQLNGSGALYGSVDSLYDLRYWQQRNRDARQAVFDRIKAVLGAWESPAQTIDKALTDNAKIIADAQNVMAPDAAKLLYDVFMRLVPMHLAIAPPASVVQTKIEKRYAELCPCDDGEPDDCCGPDVGPMSLRERLIGPQPYLVVPDKYFAIICCLVQNRYQPAKEALATAESDLASAEAKLASVAADIDSRTKSLEADAKAQLVKPFDCEQPPAGCGQQGAGSAPPSPAPAAS
ncbi:MAG TPA: hypothetical protein VNE59_12440 [Burkholderiales bacterium]|nr:hypothetical protein [Burkholderiales bacterium]